MRLARTSAAGSSMLAAGCTLMHTAGCGRVDLCDGVCLGSMAERMVGFGHTQCAGAGTLHTQHAGGVVADERDDVCRMTLAATLCKAFIVPQRSQGRSNLFGWVTPKPNRRRCTTPSHTFPNLSGTLLVHTRVKLRRKQRNFGLTELRHSFPLLSDWLKMSFMWMY